MSHILLFKCLYEDNLVVSLQQLCLVYNLQTRPLFEFPFFYHLYVSTQFFQFTAVIFIAKFLADYVILPFGLVAFPYTAPV